MIMLRLTVAGLLAVCGIVPAGAASHPLRTDFAASQVTFAVHATVDSFVGTVAAWSLDLTVPDGSDVPDRAVFRTMLTALDTGKESRNRDMLAWLEAERYPELTFTLESLQPADGGGYQARGTLSLHGKTQPLTIPVALERAGPTFTVRGEVVVDHRKFDLKPIRKFAVLTVSPEVRVAFVVQGTLE